MLKKLLMITIYLTIGYQAQAQDSLWLRGLASETTTKTQNICTIQAGDVGQIRYKSSSYEDAFQKTTSECFQRRTQLFVKARNQQPDQDRQIQFVESCLNSVKCI